MTSVWDLPPTVRATVENRWPVRRGWDPSVPGAMVEAAGFVPEATLPHTRFSAVVAGEWQGKAAVARIDPDPDALIVMGSALELSRLKVGPKVLFFDPDTAVLVTERVKPGTAADEEQPDPVKLGKVLARLRDGLPVVGAIEVWVWLGSRLAGATLGDVASGSRPPTAEEVDDAFDSLDELERGQSRFAFMHGDCSRGNILAGPRGPVLVDPRWVAGDICFDVAVAGWKCGFNKTQKRQLAKAAGVDFDRMVAWEKIARIARI